MLKGCNHDGLTMIEARSVERVNISMAFRLSATISTLKHEINSDDEPVRSFKRGVRFSSARLD